MPVSGNIFSDPGTDLNGGVVQSITHTGGLPPGLSVSIDPSLNGDVTVTEDSSFTAFGQKLTCTFDIVVQRDQCPCNTQGSACFSFEDPCPTPTGTITCPTDFSDITSVDFGFSGDPGTGETFTSVTFEIRADDNSLLSDGFLTLPATETVDLTMWSGTDVNVTMDLRNSCGETAQISEMCSIPCVNPVVSVTCEDPITDPTSVTVSWTATASGNWTLAQGFVNLSDGQSYPIPFGDLSSGSTTFDLSGSAGQTVTATLGIRDSCSSFNFGADSCDLVVPDNDPCDDLLVPCPELTAATSGCFDCSAVQTSDPHEWLVSNRTPAGSTLFAPGATIAATATGGPALTIGSGSNLNGQPDYGQIQTGTGCTSDDELVTGQNQLLVLETNAPILAFNRPYKLYYEFVPGGANSASTASVEIGPLRIEEQRVNGQQGFLSATVSTCAGTYDFGPIELRYDLGCKRATLSVDPCGNVACFQVQGTVVHQTTGLTVNNATQTLQAGSSGLIVYGSGPNVTQGLPIVPLSLYDNAATGLTLTLPQFHAFNVIRTEQDNHSC